MLKELQPALVYDVTKERFSYELQPFHYVDAKTGEIYYSPFQVTEEKVEIPRSDANFRADNKSVKELASDLFGFTASEVTISSHRESHPGETPKQIYTLLDGDDTIELSFDEESGQFLSLQSGNELRLEKATVVTREAAKRQALDFIQTFIALDQGMYVMQEQVLTENIPSWVTQKDLPTEYQLSLYPLHKGVRTNVPAVTVLIDLRGNAVKKVATTKIPLAKSAVPAPADKEAAASALVDSLDMELRYVFPSFLYQRDDQPKLAYVPRFRSNP